MRGRIHCTPASAVATTTHDHPLSISGVRLCLCLLAACLILPAHAQAKSFDLPSQSLADSLRDVGSQTDTNVLFDPRLVADRNAPPLKGDLSTGQALNRLLTGTGIKYEFLNEKTIVLASTTPPLRVRGEGAGGQTDSSALSASQESEEARDSKEEGARSKSFWDRFRLAQVDQGTATSINSSNSSSPPSNQSFATVSPGSSEPVRLEEIIVTASKREEKLSQVGVGISVVTSEQLDTLAANGLEDYLQLLPGVSLQSGGGPGIGILSIRGVSPQSVGATVATYIDDIPFGGSSALGEGGDFAPDLDPADIQRVEVLKGPQGTLYGASSLGGVIKWVTKQPNLETTDLNLSEAAEYTDGGGPGGKIRASYSTPLVDDVLAVRMSGYYRWIGGYIDDVGLRGKDANNGADWGLHGTVLYKPTTDLTISLNALTQQSRVNAYSSVDLNPATGQPLYGDLKHLRYTPEGITDRTDLVSSEITWETPYGSLLSATSFSEIKPADTADETLNFAPYDVGISPAAPAAQIGHHFDQQETEELRFTSRRLGSFEFLGGGFFQHELLRDGDSYQSFGTNGQVDPTGPFYGNVSRGGTLDEMAGFFNATYYILPQLDTSLGFRHSDLTETSFLCYGGLLFTGGDAVQCSSPPKTSEGPDTYSAGIRWRLTDGVMLYARAASGYRPGGQRGIPPGAPAGFSPVYTSDSIWSYEAGTKIRALDGRLTVDVDGFWIDWKNIQALVYVGNNNTDGNGGTARSRGLEFQSTFMPFNGLTLSANATETNAIFTQTAAVINVTAGEHLYFVPTFTGSVGADYSFPAGEGWRGNIGGDYSYTGRELDGTNHTLPSYALVNLHVGATHEKYNVSVYVKNAANKRAIIGDNGYFGPTWPVYTVNVNQPLTIGVVFSEHF